MEHSAQRTEKLVSGTVIWRGEMLGLGIIAAGLDISVATPKATTTLGEPSITLLIVLLLFLRDQNNFTFPEGRN